MFGLLRGWPGARIQFGPTSGKSATLAASGRPRPTLSKPMSGISCARAGAAITVAASAHDLSDPFVIVLPPLRQLLLVGYVRPGFFFELEHTACFGTVHDARERDQLLGRIVSFARPAQPLRHNSYSMAGFVALRLMAWRGYRAATPRSGPTTASTRASADALNAAAATSASVLVGPVRTGALQKSDGRRGNRWGRSTAPRPPTRETARRARSQLAEPSASY